MLPNVHHIPIFNVHVVQDIKNNLPVFPTARYYPYTPNANTGFSIGAV